ncbi:hypothetical protein FB45DRAFT_421647 [Roridomyces roridus]|uniref:MYND-type domain-containing protein n=1 Tax=Roridomyces roridus TaxID=1738132 RepID=A0AAD7FU49_9AGAR|nr:hypothetical protein FB45DRAFT_421647 [Roridomyces roridus]
MSTEYGPKIYVEELNQGAQKLIAAEKAGSSTDSIDFSVAVRCTNCGKIILEKEKPKVCGGCKSTFYCFPACSEEAWKPKHKKLCEANKRHMLRKPHFTQLLLQFPWGRLENDGTFNDGLARARFKVLGIERSGFWSHNGGPNSHQFEHEPDTTRQRGDWDTKMEEISARFTYVNGTPLFETKHYSDRAGWKLEPAKLIPFRNFSAEQRPPRLASESTIVDWNSWYAWRGLSKESPAALLMHFPMSVYWLLVHTLGIADPKAGSPESRVQLKVHYIGAEVELNFLPLFAELALLLPYTDISLIMFGPAVHKIVSEAKESHPKSLAARVSPTSPVFSYTAPEASGAGQIQIFLHGSDPHWMPADADAALSSYSGVPSALIAPNAGLSSYPAWRPVIVYAHQMQIPFATTEYAEQSCEIQRAEFQSRVSSEAAHAWQSVMLGAPCTPNHQVAIDAYLRGRQRKWEYPIEVNPFQRPGQRRIPTKLPNVPNGFTIQAVGK